MPEGAWSSFFYKIGVGTTPSKIGVLGIFVFLIYFSFIPNLFFIKNIKIEGAGNQQAENISSTIKSYLAKKNPWPRRNLILLSKTKLNAYLLENNQNILKIDGITKDFPNTLRLQISIRADTFAVSAPNGTFLAGSDGLIRSRLDPAAPDAGQQPGLINVKITPQNPVFAGRPAFPAELAEMLKIFTEGLAGAAKTGLLSFEIPGAPSTDITAETTSGFEIKLARHGNAQEALAKLKLIYSQLSDPEAKNLYYIDLRFDDKAYVCYKNTACAHDQSQAAAATSSPETLNP